MAPTDWIPQTDAAGHRARAERLESRGDLTGAIEAYEAALALAPDEVDLLAALAGLAGRMDMAAQALALWEAVAAREPFRLDAVDGRARALAGLGRAGEAVETLRAAILREPHEARLWNSLGVLVNAEGDSAAALAFFDEAVRLQPDLATALYNRGDVRFDLGELTLAESDFDAAARHAGGPDQTATIAFARAQLRLHRGELAEGWDAYEARLSPDAPDAPVFEAPGAPWAPQTPLKGAHLLVLAEQGLGDEIMFLSLVPDLLEALGPHGRLTLALEPRLQALAQRSFPQASVIPHRTERRLGRPHRSCDPPAGPPVDCWAPLSSLPRALRRDLQAFAGASAYLRADEARVAAWRAWLGEAPAVGLSWRSGLQGGRRSRHAPDLAAFAPVLQSGARLVHLQYGASEEELGALDALASAPLLRPPGIDLKNDLDELAALSVALGLVVSVPNATAALAAACGVETWFLTAPAAWPRLGTDHYPWYARSRSFAARRFGEWSPVLEGVALELAGRLSSGAGG